MTGPLLEIDGLAVRYRTGRDSVEAVRAASLGVAAGESVAIVGESGSGKSTTAHAVLGLLPAAAQVSGGRILFDGEDLVRAGDRRLRALRGRRIALVPQDPGTALNPVHRVGDQIAEALTVHGLADRRSAAKAALDLLAEAGVPEPEWRAGQYPHELSGGLRQRVLIAIAIAARPRLIVADEPTSALDVLVQRQILDRLQALAADSGTSLLLITHDLGVAAERADRIVVMSGGETVEDGPAARVIAAPEHPYTRALVGAAPGLGAEGPQRAAPDVRITVRGVPGDPFATGPVPERTEGDLVELTDLVKDYRAARGPDGVRRAVDGVSLRIARGETVALVGESGSGKSTTARLLLRLDDPTSGTIAFDGADVTRLDGRPLRELRRRMQLVHQNPYASLNPRLSVERLIADPLVSFGLGDRTRRRARAAELADLVALPSSVLRRRPAELSGGQRQRVAIARALAVNPDLIVCDEPVSALDVSIQAQILDLLAGLQAGLGVAYLFISHDLAVVRRIAHRTAVMRDGRVVEEGETERLFGSPAHSYTEALLTAIPGRPQSSGARV